MNGTATYDFLSWVRRGAASEIQGEDPLTGSLPYRATLGVKLRVDSARDGGAAAQDDVDVKVQLYGPGDVIGIDPRHIIRSDPEDGAQTFEPNYFATVSSTILTSPGCSRWRRPRTRAPSRQAYGHGWFSWCSPMTNTRAPRTANCCHRSR